MRNFKRKAFTLVELLVVIAIIGILFVVLISRVDFATNKAKATGVQADFRSYQLAIELVARENAGLSVLVDEDASGAGKYAKLESELNEHLDPKLRVEIDADGKISTDAKDPWKEEYLGAYLAPDADGTVKDRGAIVMYCKGVNLKLGTIAKTSNGVVNVTIESGKETEGADDYAISTIYTYVNGYGEIKTTTDGFSNDMGDNKNQGNNTPVNPETPNNPPTEPNNPEQDGEEPIELSGGLYDKEGNLIADWYTLISTYKMNIEKDYDSSTYKTDINSPYYVLNNYPELSLGQLIVVNDQVTKIGRYAFCVTLDIEIPPSVSNIGEYAFDIGYYGRNVYITDLVAWCSIDFENADANPLHRNGNLYLNNVQITDLVIPDDITNIKQYAFCGANDIKSVNFNNVVNIGQCAFFGTGLVGELIIPNSVTNIGEDAFRMCSALTGNLVIPDSVTSIGEGAFYNCTGLTSVIIGNGITELCNNVFRDCRGISGEIAIPNTITNIGEGTFQNCSNITTLTLSSNIISIEKLAFSGCSGLTSIAIPDKVVNIGESAFSGCSGISYIEIPSSIKSIERGAFQGCGNLSGVYITDLTSWCQIDFADMYSNPLCSARNLYLNNVSINNLEIPETITEINAYAFYNATNITGTLTLHNNINSVGNFGFYNCIGLTEIIIETEQLLIFANSMLAKTPSLKIYVPVILLDAYKEASGWSNFSDIIYSYSQNTVTPCPEGGNHIYYGPGLYNAAGELIASWDELVNTYGLDIAKTYNNTSGNANNYSSNSSSLHTILARNDFGDLSDGFILSIGNVSSIGNYALYKMDSSVNSNYSGPSLIMVVIPESVTTIGQYAFGDFNINRILYKGTQEQWSSVNKGTGWYGASGSSFTLHCTDGDLEASGCVSADTLILLADGTTKRIDEITYDDVVMVWNFETGTYDAAPISIIFYHGHKEHDILNLKFSDGTVLKVINDHGLYSVSENNYVYISVNNVEGYIGHQFVKYDGNAYTTVTLVEYCSTVEYTGSYCLQTAGTNNYIAEGMFSLTKPDVEGWFDYFVIGDDMKYDEAQMQTDIAKYGLYTYEDFVHTGITYEQFLAFNGPYLKVLVGRGVLTFERIEALIGQYL